MRGAVGEVIGLPGVGVGLGQADVGENAVDEVASHVCGGLRVIVEGRDAGVDDGAGVGGELHVADVDAVEGGFANAEDEGAAFFKGDVCGALDEGGGEAVADGSKSSHGAGKDDGGEGGIAAAGDAGADVRVVMLFDLGAWEAEKFLDEVAAAAEMKLLSQDAEGVGADDEIDLGDTRISVEGTEHLRRVDGAAGTGDGESEIEGGLDGCDMLWSIIA